MDDQSKKKIRELADLLKELNLGEIEVKSGDSSIRVAAQGKAVSVASAPAIAAASTAAISGSRRESSAGSSATSQSDKSDDRSYDEAKLIRSPFVGSYYESPAPGSDPFIKVGQAVTVGQTLCIVEAMKLMNEIESDKAGEIAEILVNNEDPVEFDQPLFLLK
jgi:acetyl-CoA carboxylase biotin carboxyl carrier protein